MQAITLNGVVYPLEEVAKGAFDMAELSTFEKATLSFCQAWLTGQEVFTMQTSGSTGAPKQVMANRKQMLASAMATVKTLGLETGGRALVCLNTAYIAGKMMLVRALAYDMNIIANEPSANPIEALPSDAQPNFAALVPLQIHTALKNGSNAINKLNQMRAIIVGGAPVSPALAQQIEDQLSVPVYSTYGMTETLSHIALKRLNGPEKSAYFHVLPGVEVSVNAHDCLIIKAPAISNTTLETQDVVKLIGVGQFEWLGRADYVINTGGIKVHPEVVETTLAQPLRTLLGDRRFFVTGFPDAKLGEIVTLIVEGSSIENTEQDKVLKLASVHLPKYQSPKIIRFVPAFEETATGKIHRIRTTNKVLQVGKG